MPSPRVVGREWFQPKFFGHLVVISQLRHVRSDLDLHPVRNIGLEPQIERQRRAPAPEEFRRRFDVPGSPITPPGVMDRVAVPRLEWLAARTRSLVHCPGARLGEWHAVLV